MSKKSFSQQKLIFVFFVTQEMCKPLDKRIHDTKELLKAVFSAITVYFNSTGKVKCLQWKGDPFNTQLGCNAWDLQVNSVTF